MWSRLLKTGAGGRNLSSSLFFLLFSWWKEMKRAHTCVRNILLCMLKFWPLSSRSDNNSWRFTKAATFFCSCNFVSSRSFWIFIMLSACSGSWYLTRWALSSGNGTNEVVEDGGEEEEVKLDHSERGCLVRNSSTTLERSRWATPSGYSWSVMMMPVIPSVRLCAWTLYAIGYFVSRYCPQYRPACSL